MALGVLSEKPHYFHPDISVSSLVLVTAGRLSHSLLASELPQPAVASLSLSENLLARQQRAWVKWDSPVLISLQARVWGKGRKHPFHGDNW